MTELDTTGLRSPVKVHTNCTVIDVSSGAFPRYIEVRMPGPDGARRGALWNGTPALANDDVVICHEIPNSPVLLIASLDASEDASTNQVKVTKLVSPDLATDPVISADNNGDLTAVGSMSFSAGEVITIGGNDVAVVADGVTKTVQASGGDFTTIQGAINWFKNKLIVGSCVISVEANDYDEALVFDDLFIGTAGSLTLSGDTRVLAGMSYVDGTGGNQAGLTNGGDGTVALSNSGNDITVTMSTTNPDFDADGWGSGDLLLVYDNSGTISEVTVSSVSNNVITLTAAAPTIGNDSTAILLQPDRRITRSTAGQCIVVDQVRGLTIDGFYLETSTGTDCNGIEAVNGANVVCDNVAARAEDYGFYTVGNYSAINCGDALIAFTSSAWDCERGHYLNNATQQQAIYGVAVGCEYGFYVLSFSFLQATRAIAVNITNWGFYSTSYSFIAVTRGTARQCAAIGYFANDFSFIRAVLTNANNSGNTADYSPSSSATHGNTGSMVLFS